MKRGVQMMVEGVADVADVAVVAVVADVADVADVVAGCCVTAAGGSTNWMASLSVFAGALISALISGCMELSAMRCAFYWVVFSCLL